MRKVWALFRGDVRSTVRCNKILLVMIFGYQAFYVLGAFSFLGILTIVLGGMLAYTSIAMDERDGWNRFVLTTGYTRKEYVLSKYLLAVARDRILRIDDGRVFTDRHDWCGKDEFADNSIATSSCRYWLAERC